MEISAAAVLFDNDGVLVDSHDQVVACWSVVASEFKLDVDELLQQMVGVRAADTLARHLPAERVRAACARLEQLEIEMADQTRPLRGAIELVQALPDGRWTIVTSGTRPLAEARWVGAGIPIPRMTVTADEVTKGKPDPEPFLAGARLLSVDPTLCVVFEDSAAGGASARAAGMTVVAVGHQPWAFEPSVRVADLASVSVTATGSSIELAVAPHGK